MSWSLSQRFSVRVSTMLLSYCALLPLLWGLLSTFYDGGSAVPPAVHEAVAASDWSLPGLLLVAAVFALAFLGASIQRRNPQLQYLVEFIAAVVGLLAV